MDHGQGTLNLVEDGADYALLASRDGASYTLRFKVDNVAVHLQGDDAVRFRADYEKIKLQFPAWETDQRLAQLWDQGGYSWLAVQEEH